MSNSEHGTLFSIQSYWIQNGPGFNDSTKNIEAMARFIAERLSKAVPVYLFSYQRHGEAKWESLDRKNETISVEISSERELMDCCRIFESFGQNAAMGG